MKHKAILIKIYATIKDPVFIVAFVVSFLLLLLTKLGDRYTVDLTIPVAVEGVEIERLDDRNVNIEDNYVDIGLKVRGSGYKIVQAYFSKVRIPAESFVLSQDSGVYKVDMGLFERMLSSELKDLEILKVFNHTIPVKSALKLRKEVPVRDNITLDLAGEYMQIGDVMFEPKKVWVIGFKRDLDNIDHVDTESKIISNIENHISGVVSLQKIPNVSISEKEIYYSVNVERFTEYKQNEINIQIKGYEGLDKYITLPSTIDVTYNMTREAYKNFKYSNIIYYADISNRDSSNNYLGDNKYRILHTDLPVGIEIRSISSEFVIVLKSR